MLPVTPAAAAGHGSASPLPAGSDPKWRSPILLDLQTSVSPMPQPVAEDMMPLPGLSAPEVNSPVALAPSCTAQSEAPTPTLLPRGSAAGSTVKEAVNGSPPLAPPVVLAAESPRNILSSLQQTNLQSRPFDFAESGQEGMSPSMPDQTPEPEFDPSDSSQQDAAGPVLEQTPEPFDYSTSEQVALLESMKGLLLNHHFLCSCVWLCMANSQTKSDKSRVLQHKIQQGATHSKHCSECRLQLTNLLLAAHNTFMQQSPPQGFVLQQRMIQHRILIAGCS